MLAAYLDELDTWFETHDAVFFMFVFAFAALIFAADATRRAAGKRRRKK